MQKSFTLSRLCCSELFTRRHCTRKSEQDHWEQLMNHREEEGEGEEAGQREREKRGRTEFAQHKEERRRPQDRSGSMICHTCELTNRQRRVEPRNCSGHSAPQHATPCHHRILTANQHYSTATQLRLVHKRYTRKRVRVIGKQLLQDRKKSKQFERHNAMMPD